MVDFNIEGRIALINGGSRGIGAAIARGLAEHGAVAVLSSRKQANLDAMVRAIEAAGGKAVGIACNAGRSDQIDRLFDRIQDEFGRLDILVNNAATNPYFGPVIEAPEAAYDKTFDVNCKGYFLMAQRAAKMMVRQGKGVIINISSAEGLSPEANTGVYAMTKAANIMLTKVLARELGGCGVRCNCICPGLTKTDLSRALTENPKLLKYYAGVIPMGRIGLPQEMAGLALYLASDASSYTNGAIITCDGGVSA